VIKVLCMFEAFKIDSCSPEYGSIMIRVKSSDYIEEEFEKVIPKIKEEYAAFRIKFKKYLPEHCKRVFSENFLFDGVDI
jgi:hypothetical protein